MFEWRQYTAVSKRQQGILKRVVQRLLHAKLSGAFRVWREAVRHSVDESRVVSSCIRRLFQGQLLMAFEQWRQACRETARQRLILTQAAKQLFERSVTAAFVKWMDHTANIKAQEEVLRRTVKRILSGQLAGAFQWWRTIYSIFSNIYPIFQVSWRVLSSGGGPQLSRFCTIEGWCRGHRKGWATPGWRRGLKSGRRRPSEDGDGEPQPHRALQRTVHPNPNPAGMRLWCCGKPCIASYNASSLGHFSRGDQPPQLPPTHSRLPEEQLPTYCIKKRPLPWACGVPWQAG